MKIHSILLVASAGLLASTASSEAAGKLHIFNWGEYTSPQLIEKF